MATLNARAILEMDVRDEVIIPVEKREEKLHSRTRHEGHK